MAAKQNLKQYLEAKGISPARFYKETGLSNGFLNQGDNISSNSIEIIISIYSDLSLLWLITNEGNMLKEINSEKKNAHLNAPPNAHLSSNLQDNPQYPTMAEESSVQRENTLNLSIYKRSEAEGTQPPRDTGSNELVKHLIEQLKEQSEEIGALKQENSSLKNRVAELVEDALNAERSHA